MSRIVVWFGAGAASAVAAKLTLREFPQAIVAYCQTNAEHVDNERFISDCVRWFNAPVQYLANSEYFDTWDVWETRRYIAGPKGAPCTGPLKRLPREQFQRPGDVHVFGYTADPEDRARYQRLKERWPELITAAPLISRGLDKAACLALVQSAGISLPAMYLLGFSNNNCIPCAKAQSANYWAAIRKHFPAQFDRMAKLSRELGAKLCLFGTEKDADGHRRNIRLYIDEIPDDWPTTEPIAPSCDFLCHIYEQDVAHD
jgi:hypothetical protein